MEKDKAERIVKRVAASASALERMKNTPSVKDGVPKEVGR